MSHENLMLELTALVERLELRIPEQADPVVAGFGRDGRFSIYYGAEEPAFHFDSAGRFRRAILDGGHYRSEGDHLVRLVHDRNAGEVTLRRSQVESAAEKKFLDSLCELLRGLHDAYVAQAAPVMDQFPPNGSVPQRFERMLRQITAAPIILSPAIRPPKPVS